MKSYPPSSAVVDMQLHKSEGLETGSDSQVDIFLQSRACCESDAYRQLARLSDDDNDKGTLVHPLASANPKLTRLAQVIILTLVTLSLPK
jgi:hypothetical protein